MINCPVEPSTRLGTDPTVNKFAQNPAVSQGDTTVLLGRITKEDVHG